MSCAELSPESMLASKVRAAKNGTGDRGRTGGVSRLKWAAHPNLYLSAGGGEKARWGGRSGPMRVVADASVGRSVGARCPSWKEGASRKTREIPRGTLGVVKNGEKNWGGRGGCVGVK